MGYMLFSVVPSFRLPTRWVFRDACKQSGFSLLETLIAVLVVAIALAAMLHGMGVIVQTQTALNEQARAQQVAWQQWLAVRSLASSEEKITVTQANQDWTVFTTFSDTGFPDTRQVSIRVQPSDDKQARSVQLSALVVTQ
jgi:general secretion pathway protein I